MFVPRVPPLADVRILEGILEKTDAHALACTAGDRRTKAGDGRIEAAVVDANRHLERVISEGGRAK